MAVCRPIVALLMQLLSTRADQSWPGTHHLVNGRKQSDRRQKTIFMNLTGHKLPNFVQPGRRSDSFVTYGHDVDRGRKSDLPAID